MINKKLFWIYVLSSSIYFTQGVEGLPGSSLFALLKEKLHLSPSDIMYLGALISLAWLIKPVWGILIDNLLTKKIWIMLSLIGSLFISLFLGFSPILPLIVLIPILMLGNLNTAFRDIANDGIMCVEGKENNKCDKIQVIQWISITVASILVGLFGGYIADHFNYKIAYLSLIPIYLIIIGIVLQYKNNKTEKIKSCKSCTWNSECDNDDNHICEEYIKPRLWTSILSYKELFTNKQFLLGCLFLFIYKFTPGFGTPLQFIERDTFKWSFTFMSVLGAISSIISIIGAIIYYKISSKLNIKKVLFYSVFLMGLTNLCYLYFTPVTDVIYTIIFSFLGMFIFLNTMTWMAKSTLSGKESTSFALLCSINNLSGTCSTLVGAWLLPLIGLQYLIILASLSAFLSLPILKRLEIN